MQPWQQLWWRIWLAVLAAIVLVVLLSFVLLRVLLDPLRNAPPVDVLASQIAATLPAADAPIDSLPAALERGRREAGTDLSLFDRERRPLAHAGRPLPAPHSRIDESHWLSSARRDSADRPASAREPPQEWRAPQIYALRLDDGRWLVAARNLRSARPFAPGVGLMLLAVGAGLGAYPVVRRLTRRLERLQRGVETLGAGHLHARVPVEGRDEVAQLASSFNSAAERIEQLMNSQRALLANASHELRSPLARVRLAIEMLDGTADAGRRRALRDELHRDIAELDGLIDEILLASRLDAQAAEGMPPPQFEVLDLTALAAEECARAGVQLDGAPIDVAGDARLLRRALRNLLENARRYGGNPPIEVTVRAVGEMVELTVADRGPGVAEEERSRIFEPFYRARGAAESTGGVGLGLALVARIAQRHGGRADCLPRAGGGSVFRITLPRQA
jgi:signal transduction histidine kinase